jgi:hypothetical protein
VLNNRRSPLFSPSFLLSSKARAPPAPPLDPWSASGDQSADAVGRAPPPPPPHHRWADTVSSRPYHLARPPPRSGSGIEVKTSSTGRPSVSRTIVPLRGCPLRGDREHACPMKCPGSAVLAAGPGRGLKALGWSRPITVRGFLIFCSHLQFQKFHYISILSSK